MYFEKINDTVKSLKLFVNIMLNVAYFTYFSQLSNSEKNVENISGIDEVTTCNAIAYFFGPPSICLQGYTFF